MARRRRNTEYDAPKAKLNRENLRQASYIFQFIKPYRWYFIAGFILLFLTSLIFMAFPYLMGQMVDIAQGKGALDLSLRQLGGVLLVILLVQGMISYARVLMFANVSEKGLADIRGAVYRKLLSLPVFFFEESRVGELISRITADVEKLYSTFSVTLAEFLRQVIILIVGIAFLVLTTPKLAVIMIATFPVIVVGAMFFGRFVRKLSKERQQRLADTNTILSEVLQSINSVKAFTNEWYESLRYRKSNRDVVKVSLKYARARALFAVFIITMLFGALFFIIWQAALMVQNGSITAGELIAFVSYTAIIGGAIAGLGNFYAEILGALGATQRVREILFRDGEYDGITAMQPARELEGNITFEDVQFSYPSRQDVLVLKKFSMRIEAGQKVALVGPSGAGKSTIVQLLLRFYDIQDGAIRIDGKDIYSYDLATYRSDFAIVPQEVILFGGTIRENIAYGNPEASRDEIITAAKKANAWEFIKQFPEKEETLVGERGIKLSGGQRQRIAIARAILRDPAILLLDEATSSLDSESESQVQEALNELMKGRTSIIIAHRLSTIKDVDQIFVIDSGRLVEQGRHSDLLTNADGLYTHLTKLQFDQVEPVTNS